MPRLPSNRSTKLAWQSGPSCQLTSSFPSYFMQTPTMYPFNTNTQNAHADQHNGNGNIAQANYNFDNSGPQLFDMQNGNSNADRDLPNNPQLMLYQAYQQLHQAVVGRQQAITSYHDLVVKHEAQVSALKDHIDKLKGEIDTLKDELRAAKADAETSRLSHTRYIISYLNAKHSLMVLYRVSQLQSRASATTLAPSDSVSNVDPDFPLGPEQPADKPEKYPQEILWTLADAQDDRTVFPGNHTNTSRPPMEKALRNEDGSMISRISWEVIKLSAKSAIGTYLRKLNADEVTKKCFRTNHTKEWNSAIAYLEKARPLVGLCAGHWKAEHVLGTVLTSERSSTKRAGKRAQKRAQPTSSEGEDFGNMPEDGDDDDDNDGDNAPVYATIIYQY